MAHPVAVSLCASSKVFVPFLVLELYSEVVLKVKSHHEDVIFLCKLCRGKVGSIFGVPVRNEYVQVAGPSPHFGCHHALCECNHGPWRTLETRPSSFVARWLVSAPGSPRLFTAAICSVKGSGDGPAILVGLR